MARASGSWAVDRGRWPGGWPCHPRAASRHATRCSPRARTADEARHRRRKARAAGATSRRRPSPRRAGGTAYTRQRCRGRNTTLSGRSSGRALAVRATLQRPAPSSARGCCGARNTHTERPAAGGRGGGRCRRTEVTRRRAAGTGRGACRRLAGLRGRRKAGQGTARTSAGPADDRRTGAARRPGAGCRRRDRVARPHRPAHRSLALGGSAGPAGRHRANIGPYTASAASGSRSG
jgi:hypothetical protein